MNVTIGTGIGSFEVLTAVGAGGMGEATARLQLANTTWQRQPRFSTNGVSTYDEDFRWVQQAAGE